MNHAKRLNSSHILTVLRVELEALDLPQSLKEHLLDPYINFILN